MSDKRAETISLWVPIIDEDGEPEMQEWYGEVSECPLCGHVSMDESKYCGGCGTRLVLEEERGR